MQRVLQRPQLLQEAVIRNRICSDGSGSDWGPGVAELAGASRTSGFSTDRLLLVFLHLPHQRDGFFCFLWSPSLHVFPLLSLRTVDNSSELLCCGFTMAEGSGRCCKWNLLCSLEGSCLNREGRINPSTDVIFLLITVTLRFTV